jgi:L-ascorbate metabolism protein UlaG (beta-lactamase superfamily)
MSATYDDLTFERPGHATVRIETDEGTVIYIDPWADVLGGSPGDGDVVFVTHDDPDHYDPDGIAAVASPDVTVAVFEAIDTGDLEYDAISLPQEGTASVDGIEVETHPSYNEPDGEHVNDLGRPFHARGEVIGLVVTLDRTRIFYPTRSRPSRPMRRRSSRNSEPTESRQNCSERGTHRSDGTKTQLIDGQGSIHQAWN